MFTERMVRVAIETVVSALGSKIKVEEIDKAWEDGKDALPKIANAANEIVARVDRLEKKLDSLMLGLNIAALQQMKFEHQLGDCPCGLFHTEVKAPNVT